MKALITGASSGIGKEIAVILGNLGYDIYAVARRGDKLNNLKEYGVSNLIPLVYDLSDRAQCFALWDKIGDIDFDIVVNNAGLGVFGDFDKTNLTSELMMIDTNITALHILTKLFASKFKKTNRGKILNVASTAGYMMGPFLSSYYATKSYVLRYSQAVNRELKESGSVASVSVLCPGPVITEFDSVAGVKNSFKGMSARKVAQIAVRELLNGKEIIIPGFTAKISVFLSVFIPDSVLSKITYNIQKKKQ